VEVKVWGDHVLFSRLELSVEMVSYLVVTPSAARGVLEAIFWRPEIKYEVLHRGAEARQPSGHPAQRAG
jgi:CRISPR-associated protein Cas5d